jgi:diguanylate cyclase (GGDEF)-like protein/PAS domain S-box-containing protein
MILNQIFDAINLGIVVLDRDLLVQKWNRWMEIQSGIDADKIIGKSIFEIYPDLENSKFKRSCKSVFSFGNFCFFSQKLHGCLFPFESSTYLGSEFEYMQQSCAMGPLRDDKGEIASLYIYVQDVTENAAYQEKLKDLNIKDGLTGTYNRRFLEARLKEEFFRYKRYSGKFSMIMIDIDNFKEINDVHGHQCGDFILKMVSARISSAIRNIDYLIRYGGDEFCCLLPETGLEGAFTVAERFRALIEFQDNNYDDKVINITISLGVSTICDSVDTPEVFIQKADEALYKAKEEGRNKAVAMD